MSHAPDTSRPNVNLSSASEPVMLYNLTTSVSRVSCFLTAVTQVRSLLFESRPTPPATHWSRTPCFVSTGVLYASDRSFMPAATWSPENGATAYLNFCTPMH